MNGTRAVIGAMVATGIIVTADEIVKGGGLPPLRAYLGLVFAGIMLGALAEPAPELAAGLAALMVVGVALTRGVRVAKAIGG